MAKQKNTEGYIKKETTLVIALIAVVVGFLGGIFYSAIQSDTGGTVQTVSAPVQQQQQSQLTSEQAKNILTLEQEVATNPTNVNAWIQLGNVYFDTDNYDNAIRAYEKSLELSPNNAYVLTDLGVMYRRSGQPQKALESFDRAIAIVPSLEQASINKGIVLLYDLQDRDGAKKAWEALLKINPNATTADGQSLREAVDKL
ncbi:MAG: tetratricopeptide repeat protein [Desulfobulbales bacterium]